MNPIRFSVIVSLFALASLHAETRTVAAGPDVKLKKATPELYVGQQHEIAPEIAPDRIPTLVSGKTPRNIILIIGDGMGLEAIKGASLHGYGREGALSFERFPVTGRVSTRSANRAVTDSAASATALACGIKTDNSRIGMGAGKMPELLRSIGEAAKAKGKAVGVITNDQLTGATPAAFSSHAPTRGEKETIALGQIRSGYDILIGSKSKTPFEKRKDGKNLLKGSDYHVIGDGAELPGAPLPVIGFFYDNRNSALGKTAAAAAERLAADPDGFFLMVENTWSDWGGHGNNPEYTVKGALGTDFIVQDLLAFVKKHPETLIVVTADHETGGLTVTPNPQNPKNPAFRYSITSHTGTDVGVFAAGPGAENFRGKIDNTAIPRAFAKFWGVEIGQIKEN